MQEATKEQYEELRKTCKRMLEDTNFAGYSGINFIDFTKYLDKLKVEFPDLKIKQTDFGISVDKI